MARDSQIRVKLRPDGLEFPSYPFGGASVQKQPFVPLSAIAEVVPLWYPPAVLTRDGEFLFLTYDDREALIAWARGHGLPIMERHDPWDRLLSPFLDTEYTAEQAKQDETALAEMGLAPAEVKRWRRRVSGRMETLTAISWDWVCYGLYDLLFATQTFVPWEGGRSFYQEVMAVARLGGGWPASDKRLEPPATPLPREDEPAGALEIHCLHADGRLAGRVWVMLSRPLQSECDGGTVSATGPHGKVAWERLKPGHYTIYGRDWEHFGPDAASWTGQVDVHYGQRARVVLKPQT